MSYNSPFTDVLVHKKSGHLYLAQPPSKKTGKRDWVLTMFFDPKERQLVNCWFLNPKHFENFEYLGKL